MAVINCHCSRTVLPLTPPETQKLASREPSVHWAKTCPPNSPDLNTLTCYLGWSLADEIPSSKFLLSWQNEESDCQSMAETTTWRSHRQFITFITFLLTVNVIRQMAPLFSKVDSAIFRMKRPWLVPNVVKICWIFLKLQAVKQSGPVFWPTRYAPLNPARRSGERCNLPQRGLANRIRIWCI